MQLLKFLSILCCLLVAMVRDKKVQPCLLSVLDQAPMR